MIRTVVGAAVASERQIRYAAMALTEIQALLVAKLRDAAGSPPTRRVVYHSECLGYLPFGFYHWFTVGGEDVSLDPLLNFSSDDVAALERIGILRRVDEWTNPADATEARVTFEVTAA